MDVNVRAGFRLGTTRVTPSEHRIARADATVRVEPKVMEVLVCLAETGTVVLRDDLIRAVWGDVIVTDHVLSRCISELRKALGDDHREPRFIETIRTKGYRLIPPAEPLVDPIAVARRPRRVGWVVAGVLVIAGGAWLASGGQPRPGWIEEIPLTSYQGSELDPAVSPDGLRIAFSWNGPDRDNFDIYVKPIGSERPRRLTDHAADESNPAWSPDGRDIAFVHSWIEGSGIWVVAAEGGPARELAGTVSGHIPDLIWAPDGRSLLFVDRQSPSEPYSVYRLDLETLERLQLTAPADHMFGDRDLALSRDGRRLAFARAELEGVEDLFCVDAAGGTPVRLTRDRSSITGIEWALDERTVLFSSDRIGSTRLWRVAVGGGVPEPVLGFGDRASDPDLTVASRLAYERRHYRFDVWRAERGADGRWRDPRPFIASTRSEASPSFAPNGRQVAFISDRSGQAAVWLCDADGGGLRRLVDVGDDFPEALDWSPDGEHIAFARRDETRRSDLFVVTVATGVVRRVTDDDALDVAPRWSPDGRSLLFGSDRSGGWQVWRVAVDGSELVQVTHDGAIAATQVGDQIYFVRPHRAGLYRQPLAGGAIRQIATEPDPRWRTDVSVTAARIYFVTTDAASGTCSVHELDCATGETSDLAGLVLPRPALPGLGFAVAPGGDVVLFGYAEMSESDLLMVEGFR